MSENNIGHVFNITSQNMAAYRKAAAQDTIDAGKVNTSVLPNNSGAIKTRFRIANKHHASGETHYYPLCKFPTDNGGNYASAIISGRIGGWEASNMSSITALAWNRGSSGIAFLDIAGTSTTMGNIWANSDLVIYKQSDGTDIVYIKCNNYYAFDLDLELYQNEATILYDGSYTTNPGGTLVADAKTSSQRAELINGALFVGGVELAKKTDIPDISGKLDANKIQYSSIDIGEGAALATGTFYFVYE